MLYTSSDTPGSITRSPQLKGVRKLLAGPIYKCKMHAPCPSRLHEKDRISCDYRSMRAKLSVCHESCTEIRRADEIQSWLIYPYTHTLPCGLAMAGEISGLPGAIPIKYLRTGRKHRYGHWTRRIVPGILYAQSLIYSKEALALAYRS